MIAIDTNIIVRLLTRDEEKQFQKAMRLFSKENIFIPDTVLLETEWVLRYAYGFKPTEIHDAFAKLLGLANVKVETPERIALAIDLGRKGLDLADALHLAASQQHKHFATFDTKFIRKAKGRIKCRVRQP